MADNKADQTIQRDHLEAIVELGNASVLLDARGAKGGDGGATAGLKLASDGHVRATHALHS